MEERGIELALEPEEEPTTDSEVFYNPDMLVNRDISVACLQEFQGETGRELRVCDALAASGIRGMRFVKEVEGLKEVIINDIREEAVENVRENLSRNGIVGEEMAVYRKDANLLLTENFRSLDYVDIDPFGSPVPYLDSTARSLRHNSAAGFTATDLGPIYGSYPEVCRRRYGSAPLKVSFGHEIGLRILVKEVFRAFSRYDKAFTPLMAWHEQHYSRVFGRVEDSKKQCNRSLEDIGFLSFCPSCRWRDYVGRNECPGCGEQLERAGPLWTGRLAEPGFVSGVVDRLGQAAHIEAADLARLLEEEAEIETPFYDTHELAAANGVQAPGKGELLDTLRDEGYRARETHFSPQGFRTDAPISVIAEVLTPG